MIFYFSATGNSQYAAERIAQATDDKVISIGIALKDKHFEFDISNDSFLGFVVPTFAWTLPGAVADFIDKLSLKGYNGQYVYGVFTCGESSGHEAAALNTLLERKSIKLHNAYDLIMPDNFIIWSNIPSQKALNIILDAADKSLEGIISAVKQNAQRSFNTAQPHELFMPISEISTSDGTSKFYVTEECIKCGLCRTVCPMSCIAADDKNRPVWEGKCTMCLKCLHSCPAMAIQHGKDTIGKDRYINPRIKPRNVNNY